MTHPQPFFVMSSEPSFHTWEEGVTLSFPLQGGRNKTTPPPRRRRLISWGSIPSPDSACVLASIPSPRDLLIPKRGLGAQTPLNTLGWGVAAQHSQFPSECGLREATLPCANSGSTVKIPFNIRLLLLI